MDYKPMTEGEPAGTTTTATTSTQPPITKEPEYPPQPVTTVTTVKKGNTTVTVVDVDPSSHPATSVCDALFITSTLLSAFASALSFPGVWNSTYHYNQVSSTYVAFAYLFLFSTWPQSIFLIEGLTRIPVQRVGLLQKTLIATVWNLCVLIIAIATQWTSIQVEKAPQVPALVVASACLLAAIVLETALFACQIAATVITSKNDAATLAVYLPVIYAKPVVQGLLVANAVLFNIVLAFAVGSMIYLVPMQGGDLSGIYNSGAAFSVIFFFVALIGTVISIMALIPTAIPGAALVLASWIFSFFAFIVALITWFLQIFSQQESVPDQFLVSLLGWIFALGTLCLGVATFCVMEARVCGATRPNSTLFQVKELAEIEKAKLDAIQYRKQREALEFGHSPAQV